MSTSNFNVLFTHAYIITLLVVAIIYIAALWKLFTKAGEPGWTAIIPFYNSYVLSKITFGNGWLFILSFIPIISFFYSIILLFKLAKVYGKSTGFGFGLLFLSIIFIPILAFGSSTYFGVDNSN